MEGIISFYKWEMDFQKQKQNKQTNKRNSTKLKE